MDTDHAAFAELEFETDDASYPSVRLSRALNCRLELLEFMRTDDGPVSFVRLFDNSADDLADRAAGLDAGVDGLAVVGDEVIARFSPSESVVETLARHGVLTQSAATGDGVARVTAVLSGSTDPRRVVEAVRDAHPSVSLVGKRHRDVVAPLATQAGARSLFDDLLTDRQWEAVRLAYERGYFDEPRACSQTELADAMGISQKTFSQHLGAAQRKLLGVVFDQ